MTANVFNISDRVSPDTAENSEATQAKKFQEIQSFISLLQSSTDVEVLHLSQVSIGVDVARLLGNELANHGELKELHMVAAFKGKEIKEVVQCLEAISAGVAQSGCQLRVLNMSENAFRGTGIRSLSSILTGPASYTLEELNMRDQGLSPEGGQELASMLMLLIQNAALDGHPLALKTIKASKNRLENAGASAIGNVLSKLSSLREAEFFQCGITAPGISNLVKGLSANRGLRSLDILDNTANGEAQKALATAIKNWPELEDLRIYSCLITDGGMTAILSAIKRHCPSIKTLDIGENDVGRAVQDQVSDLLLGMPCLESVVLAGNEFYDDKNVRKLLQAKFADAGKPDAIKSRLAGSHTYDDDTEDQENSEEEGEINDVEGTEGEDDKLSENEGTENDFILEAEGDSMWSVSLPRSLRYRNYADHREKDDVFYQRMENNNAFAILGDVVNDLNALYEENEYHELILRLLNMVFEYADKRASEEEHRKRLIADHQLEAVLQYTEYLVAFSIIRSGSRFFEEFFQCCGLPKSKSKMKTDENLLPALSWLLRHLMYTNMIPLYIIGKVAVMLRNPVNRNTVDRLKKLEGFSTVFEEVERQAA